MHAAFVAEHAEHRLADAEAQAEAVIGKMRVRAESFVAELEGTHSHRVAALERVAEDRAVDLERMHQMMLNMRLEMDADIWRVHAEVSVLSLRLSQAVHSPFVPLKQRVPVESRKRSTWVPRVAPVPPSLRCQRFLGLRSSDAPSRSLPRL